MIDKIIALAISINTLVNLYITLKIKYLEIEKLKLEIKKLKREWKLSLATWFYHNVWLIGMDYLIVGITLANIVIFIGLLVLGKKVISLMRVRDKLIKEKMAERHKERS